MGERAFLSATGMNRLTTMQEVVESSTSKQQLLLLPGHCDTGSCNDEDSTTVHHGKGD